MRDELKHQKNLQELLEQVIDLLKKQQLVETLVHKQDTPRQELVQSLVERQHLAELQNKLDSLHPADVAFILENLSLKQRKIVWDLVKVEHDGAILLEVSDAVRESLIEDMENSEIIGAAKHLDSDEIADLVPALPKDMVLELLTSLDSQNRARVQSALSFPEGTVGALMDFDLITIRYDVSLNVVLRSLRRRKELPKHIAQLFVVDRAGNLKGLLLLRDLLLHDPEILVEEVMDKEPFFFYTNESAREAALAFERYDLISSPVVNSHHQLVGCLEIDAVVDFVQETSQKEMLSQVGLQEEEDLFAPIWKSAKNRWVWLAVNILVAFIVSRIISVFEATIEQVVALATLMPIVANIGGNTGNQTIALIIRGLAFEQIHANNFWHLLFKEVGISLMNGALWGSVVGVFAFVLYHQFSLALVMIAAMMCNLLVASLVGVFVPVILHKLGRDPAIGSSVMLTAMTDSMGFFIFLGLATIFLL